MRITNSMIRTNSLWSINKNEELLSKYNSQVSTGKKIQKPSDDPIVAVRALKFRTNVSEIGQYKTNSEDAESWLSVTEQAMKNTTTLLQRARELCVQGASDIFNNSDRESIISELEQIKGQFLNEGNVNYAGRFIFSGFKTDSPLVFTDTSTDIYNITEDFTSNSIETIKTVDGTTIKDAYRLRLAYSDITSVSSAALTGAGFTINSVNSGTVGAYEPAVDTVNFIADTGEVVFSGDNVNNVAPALALPANFGYTYSKTNFEKYDLVPEHYFNCTNTTTGQIYTKPADEMVYQISYNQEITVNTTGNKVFTTDLARDFEEMINAVKGIDDDGSFESDTQEDLLSDFFNKMLTRLDNHLNTVIREESVIGSKMNRLELTINRLEDDNVNFTELMSLNEDVDMTEAVLNLQAQETIYNAAMMSSARLMQQSLLDFLN